MGRPTSSTTTRQPRELRRVDRREARKHRHRDPGRGGQPLRRGVVGVVVPERSRRQPGALVRRRGLARGAPHVLRRVRGSSRSRRGRTRRRRSSRPAGASSAAASPFQDEHGNWFDPRDQRPATVVGGAPDPNPHDLHLIEVLHHRHWIHRWQMAPRAWLRLRTLMWDLAPEWMFGLNDRDVECRGRAPRGIGLQPRPPAARGRGRRGAGDDHRGRPAPADDARGRRERVGGRRPSHGAARRLHPARADRPQPVRGSFELDEDGLFQAPPG